ncbi:MAG: thioredoxin family protein [bacterium]
MENKNIKIQVLGSGCATCKKLYESVKEAVVEMNLGLEVEYVTDIQKIVSMGIMSSPAIAINDKPVLAGSLPNKEKIKQIISDFISNNKNESDTSCGCSCNGKC